jgi:hypothetical protein
VVLCVCTAGAALQTEHTHSAYTPVVLNHSRSASPCLRTQGMTETLMMSWGATSSTCVATAAAEWQGGRGSASGRSKGLGQARRVVSSRRGANHVCSGPAGRPPR